MDRITILSAALVLVTLLLVLNNACMRDYDHTEVMAMQGMCKRPGTSNGAVWEPCAPAVRSNR